MEAIFERRPRDSMMQCPDRDTDSPTAQMKSRGICPCFRGQAGTGDQRRSYIPARRSEYLLYNRSVDEYHDSFVNYDVYSVIIAYSHQPSTAFGDRGRADLAIATYRYNDRCCADPGMPRCLTIVCVKRGVLQLQRNSLCPTLEKYASTQQPGGLGGR